MTFIILSHAHAGACTLSTTVESKTAKNSSVQSTSAALIKILLHFVKRQKLNTEGPPYIVWRMDPGYAIFEFQQNEGGVVKELTHVRCRGFCTSVYNNLAEFCLKKNVF
mgnify:CR=1 FL=1